MVRTWNSSHIATGWSRDSIRNSSAKRLAAIGRNAVFLALIDDHNPPYLEEAHRLPDHRAADGKLFDQVPFRREEITRTQLRLLNESTMALAT